MNEAKICVNSSVELVNQSSSASKYYWDFCPENFTEPPTNNQFNAPDVSLGYGYKMVEDNGMWYGFMTLRSTNKLIRFDFGSSPDDTPINIVDLGNPSGLFSAPEGLDFYKEGNNWFAFVGKGENSIGQVVRLSFGNSLINPPTATGFGTFGLGTIRVRDLKIVKQGTDIILILLIYNGNSISRINFGNSLLNAPATPSTVAIPGSSLPRGLSITHSCSPWILHIVSENGVVLQASFGNDILGSVSVLGTFNFGTVLAPWKIQTVYSGGSYYAIISNNNKAYSLINFGDLSLSEAPIDMLNTNDVRFIGLDAFKFEGKILITGFSTNNSVNSVIYHKNCQITNDYSDLENPEPFSLPSGIYPIDLSAKNETNEVKYFNKNVNVQDKLAPVVQISTDNSCVSQSNNFAVSSNDPLVAWSWDFGNGQQSTLENPNVQYASTGLYNITVEVENADQCINSDGIELSIYHEPVPDFDLPPASPICTNQEYLFANTSTFDTGSNPTWQWEVNGAPVSFDQDLTYTISSAVMQDVKLKTSIPGCSNEITKTINTVEDGPLADFTFSNDCEDKAIAFTNATVGSVTGYTWDYGDGNNSAQTDGLNFYSNFGQFDVTLEATNAAGCINTKIKPITIYSKPQPDFSLDLPPFSCNGSPSQFNDLTPNPVDSNLDSWTWNFGDAQNGTSIDKNPQYVYADAGDYDVTLDVTTNFGCTALVQKTVSIFQSPNADFTFNPACVNQGTIFTPMAVMGVSSWQWKIGVSTYNQQSPTHVFSASSNYDAQLTVNGSNGCIGVLTKSVAVPVPASANFISENNCAGQTATFIDTTVPSSDPIANRVWQFGSLGVGEGASSNFTFSAPGSYPTKLTLTNESGCSYSISKNVTIVNSPIAQFNATPQIGTPPLTVQLTNTSSNIVSQLWEFNDANNSSSTTATPSFTFNELGEYIVDLTVFNSQGCSAAASKIISVIIPSLDVELSNVMLIPAGTGEINVLISLINNSNSPISNIKAFVDISGETLLSEIIPVEIQPGQSHSQVLAASILGVRTGIDYVCVNLILDGDADNSNNRKCVNSEPSTIILDPYPNPGSDILNIDWITNNSGEAIINIFDPAGRKVYEKTFSNINEGLNRVEIPLTSYNPGLYYLLFVSESTRKSFSFVVRK